MHHDKSNMKGYHAILKETLADDFLPQAMDKLAVAYRANRAGAFKGINTEELFAQIAASKDAAIENNDALLLKFKFEAEKRGAFVHFVKDAEEANNLVAQIAKDNNCKRIVKSKSLTTEETFLNKTLEKHGYDVVETDLGEWIIQLRQEPPSHLVLPAVHLSRDQVAESFSEVTKTKLSNDIDGLCKVARMELREKFVEADMGISGVNFAVAETGSLTTLTNEGNLCLVTTLPRVHVAFCGIDKVVGTIDDALLAMRAIPRAGTGQAITCLVTWICGTVPTKSAESGTKRLHIVMMDNGRSKMLNDPIFKEAERCVRCAACSNVCPVYRMVGGQQMGHIYVGAIGLILTYFLHGRDAARCLIQNCVNCEACRVACSANIDLPRLIRELRARISEEDGAPLEASLLGKVMKSRKLFHNLLRFAKVAQRPVTGGTKFIRHLPSMFMPGQDFRALPALAAKPFRDMIKDYAPLPNPKARVALFAGCAGDFIYPEQLIAAVELLRAHNVDVTMPDTQSCCGLPVEMMGQRGIACEVAMQNVQAFADGKYDAVLTLCASCASHIKHTYPKIITDPDDNQKVQNFVGQLEDFSSYLRGSLALTADNFSKTKEKVAYHAACHLCRGLNVTEEPRELIGFAADYLVADEEDVCCGFGGTYSVKFPEVSEQILAKKLANLTASGADRVVMDCPGCVMQIRGGFEAAKSPVKVTHISELLLESMKAQN